MATQYDPFAVAMQNMNGAPSAPAQVIPGYDPFSVAGKSLNYQAPISAPSPAAPPSAPTDQSLGGFAKDVGLNAVSAFGSLPRSALQGVDWLGSQVGLNPHAADVLGNIPLPGSPGKSLFPTFQDAKSQLQTGLGVTPYQAPNEGMRLADSAGTAGLMAMAGNPAGIPAAVGFGAASQGMNDALPGHPVVSTIAGLLAGHAVGSIGNTAGRLVASASGAAPNSTYAAYNRLGIPTNLAGDVTGDPGLQFAQKLAGSMPGSETAVAHAGHQAVTAWQDALHNTASQLGYAATAQEAGASLQSGANNWLKNFKDTSTENWTNFKNMVPPQTPVAVPGFQKALGSVLQDYGGADELAKVLQPGLADKLQTALQKQIAAPPAPAARISSILSSDGTPIQIDPSADEMENYLTAVQNSGKLPWQAVQAVRSAIGEKLENPMAVSDASQSALKRLYGGLTADMNGGAKATSPEALQVFDEANAYTAAGHNLLDDHLNGILNATNPENATQFALAQARQGGSRLAAIQSAMPQAFGNLSSYQLRNLAGGEESPVSFTTALAGKRPTMSPEAQWVMFGNTPVSESVADLQTTGNAMKQTASKGNNSGTAMHTSRGIGKIIAAAELARQGAEIAGPYGAAAGGALGLLAPNILGRAAQVTALNPLLSKLYSVPPPINFSQGLIPKNPAIALPAMGGLLQPSN